MIVQALVLGIVGGLGMFFVEERLAVIDSPVERRELVKTARAMLGEDARLLGSDGL